MAGHTFKVGDRVEVIDADGCEEWYSAGSTGTIRGQCVGGYWIDFDPPHGKLRRDGTRDWYASAHRLRLLTPNDNAQKVADTELLFAAVKRLGLRSPVFLDGYRVSFPEAEVVKLATTVEAIASLSAEWRSRAAWFASRHSMDLREIDLRDAFNRCADQLDAALRQVEGT